MTGKDERREKWGEGGRGEGEEMYNVYGACLVWDMTGMVR